MAKEIKDSNAFLDDDDEVDDFEFLNPSHRIKSGYMYESESPADEDNALENRRKQLLEERRRIEERTLQSTNNSLGLLHESEQVGMLTAEELVRQREQLENIEGNLDVINSTMRTSQKHINSIKSMFGGLKNYFTKGGQDEPIKKVPTDPQPKKPSSHLNDTIENLRADTKLSEATHPALRIRDLPYDEPDAFSSKVSPDRSLSPPGTNYNANIEDKLDTNLARRLQDLSLDEPGAFNFEVSPERSQFPPGVKFEEKLDKNMEFMSLGLGRLKNLAIGLNEEIEQQNEMIDLIHNKADKADETLEYQNRQIKRILKK